MKLIELLCARLRVAIAREEEVVFLSLPTRLARLLLRLLEENRECRGGGQKQAVHHPARNQRDPRHHARER